MMSITFDVQQQHRQKFGLLCRVLRTSMEPGGSPTPRSASFSGRWRV